LHLRNICIDNHETDGRQGKRVFETMTDNCAVFIIIIIIIIIIIGITPAAAAATTSTSTIIKKSKLCL